MPTQRYKLIVAYDGTNYSGWQVQPGKVTVQGELERALASLTHESVRVNCSGRTDRGVHARAQVVHFDLQRIMRVDQLARGINRFLKHDIRVITATRARASFDARMSASGKEYRYFIWNEPVMPPHLRLYNTHVYYPLDVKAMRAAAAVLEGTHDFAAFSANPGHEREGTVRTIYQLRIIRRGPQYVIVARGSGFLFKMVRSLAGFLIRVGQGDLVVDDAERILKSKTRTARVPTADPQGLFLWNVFYGKPPSGAA